MQNPEARPSREQPRRRRGAAQEGDSAPSRPPGIEKLREYVVHEGPTVDREPVAAIREFIRDRTARVGSPPGLSENQIINTAALHAYELMGRMQEKALTRGVPFAADRAMRAGVIDIVMPTMPHDLTEHPPGAAPKDPVNNHNSRTNGSRASRR